MNVFRSYLSVGGNEEWRRFGEQIGFRVFRRQIFRDRFMRPGTIAPLRSRLQCGPVTTVTTVSLVAIVSDNFLFSFFDLVFLGSIRPKIFCSR